MAFCANCGHPLADGAKFCFECGAPVTIKNNSDELSIDVNISIKVVLKGRSDENTNVEVYLAHLNKTVALTIPNNVSLGQTFRLRGMGHISPDGDKGNAYIRIVQIDYDSTSQKSEESHGRIYYEGEVRKCPQCGEVINSFVAACPSCGYELRGVAATSVVHEFSLKIGHATSYQTKENLIRNFYIPNTREDIIEFFILAISNIETDAECREAWAAKLEQTYQKAKLTFGNTSEFEYIEELHKKSLKLLQKKRTLGAVGKSVGVAVKLIGKFGTSFSKSLLLKCILLGITGVFMMTIGFFKGADSGNSDSPFYMLALVGLLPFIFAFVIPMAFHKGEPPETHEDDDEYL